MAAATVTVITGVRHGSLDNRVRALGHATVPGGLGMGHRQRSDAVHTDKPEQHRADEQPEHTQRPLLSSGLSHARHAVSIVNTEAKYPLGVSDLLAEAILPPDVRRRSWTAWRTSSARSTPGSSGHSL
ncbi:hypothetical protein [Streptomyces sp. NPDC059479]|uniref:hypothetical protein n=1 Tax=Streptomyces sp. NPDC059479 TaxID=3346848 RepID=UPI0036B3FB17